MHPLFFEEIGWRQLTATLPFSNAKYHEEKAQSKSEQKGLLCLRGLQWTKQKLLHFIDYMYSWDLASLLLNSKKGILYEGAVTLEDLALFMWLESKLEWDQCPPCETSVQLQLRVFTLLPKEDEWEGNPRPFSYMGRMPQKRKRPTQSTCQFYYLL